MLTGEPEPVDWLIDAVVARGTLTLLAGREKEGKSLLSLAFAARAVVGGGTLAGIDVASASVVIVDAENGQREVHRRLRSLQIARHDEDSDRRRRRLRNPACRYEQEADDRWLRIEADRERGLLLVDEAQPFHPTAGAREDAAAALVAALNGKPTTWADWARDADLDPSRVRRAAPARSSMGTGSLRATSTGIGV